MGGKSKSSSSSSTRTTYNTTDNRLAVEGGGFGVGAGAEVEINLTDGGAIEALETGFEALPDIVGHVADFAGGVVEDNTAILAEKLEDNSKEIAESTIKMVLLAGTAIAVAAIWMRKR